MTVGVFYRRRPVAGFKRLRALHRATSALYGSKEPYAPYRTVNNVQRVISTMLPRSMAFLVPPDLRAAAGKRAAQSILASAQAGLVQEAILAWHGPDHRARVLLPPSAWKSWSGGRGRIRRAVSLLLFTVHLAHCWLRGLRRLMELMRHMRAASAMPLKPYAVAMHVGPDVVHCAAKGGFLRWLMQERGLLNGAQTVVIASRLASASDAEKSGMQMLSEVLPPLDRVSFAFLLRSCLLLILAPVLALGGAWQALVLAADLVEAYYARQVPDDRLARSYLFLLGEQMRRPLWTFYAASRGARTPLIFFASSYQLFTYGAEVPADIRHPALSQNIWDECWFQTERARDDVARLFSHHPDCRVVGPFDMVDSGETLTQLPVRCVAAFDVEPNGKLLRLTLAGYILPTLTEDVIIAYWRKLAEAARALDFVIVHKVKRFYSLRHEWRYRNLLQGLRREGRYIELAPSIGPLRLMHRVAASVILPFTSVGDLAVATEANAFYLDAAGTIPNPERFAGGLPVVAGGQALTMQLAECLGEANSSPKVSA